MQETPRRKILSESRVDYKYGRIMQHVPADYNCRPFSGLLQSLMSFGANRRPDVLHIRYLKWRGYLGTALRYGLLVALCKLRGVRVVWTCHNVREYNVPSGCYNDVLRGFLGAAADAIVVFDESLVNYLGRHEDKVHVACFGEFLSQFDDVGGRPDGDLEFVTAYRRWLQTREDGTPLILFIGSYAPSKHVEALIEIARRNPDMTVVIVAPGMERPANVPENLFLHTRWLTGGVRALLEEDMGGATLGFVGHGNISVPTALYLYASFGLPVLALNHPPTNRIVVEHDLGLVIDGPADARAAIAAIEKRQTRHRKAAEEFLRTHSWARSAEVHREAFGVD